MSSMRKLSLLIWKNFLIQRRHKWHTLLEVVSPILFSLILILVRGLVDPTPRSEVVYPPFDPTNMTFSRMVLATFVTKQNIYLAYSPETNLTREVLDKALQRISKDNKDMVPNIPFHTINISRYIPKMLPFANAADMESALLMPNAMSDIFAGIQFDDSISDAQTWPDDIEMTIRFPAVMRQPMIEHPVRASWRTSLQYPLLPQPGPRQPDDIGGGPLPGYSTEGFLAMQHAISQEIIKQKTGEPEKIEQLDIKLQRFPHLPYREDRILTALERFISLIIMLCFAETAVHIVKTVTVEKELQLKETMRIMGLPSWLHWLAWFINQFTFLFISVLMMVIMFKIPWHKSSTGLESYSVLTHTSWSVVLAFMSLYAAATICFCFMISVMFARASVAASFMGLAWFVSYSLFMMVQVQVADMSLAARLMLCLVSNTAMGYAFQMCIICEGSSKGLHWSELWEPVSYNDPFVPGHVMMMLAVDCVLYTLVALYVEKVRPGQYGVPLPWYFPITKAFWCPAQYKIDVMPNPDEGAAEYAAALLEVVHDEEPAGAEIGVNIINLSKVYRGADKTQLKAVDRLNLRLYQDEISVLLGHNGAGKTTTVSMLTGMIPPSSGTAHIAGYDIRRDTWAARGSLGLCPQHNVLFPDLTVDEHLRFFAQLKGVPRNRLDSEVDHYVTLLQLEEKRDVPAEHLSGGQKRRLSVSLALCGGSRVVLLDEPTSGLDPAARRALWELLLRERKGRTMILTTHFMDEADVLADRIAIMSGGRLQCVGTPFFLKQHYGTGYRLTVVKSSHCNVEACTALLRQHVPGLDVNTDIGSELSYLLPNEHSSRFEAMLKQLELESGLLGLESFGLSVTTLEEVFMKTGVENSHGHTENDKKNNIYSVTAVNGTKMEPTHLNMEFMPAFECTKVTGYKLIMNHIRAMFKKRLLSSLRNYILNTIQVLSVIINIVLTIMVVRSWRFVTILPSMSLDLERGYEKTVTLSAQSEDLTPEDVGFLAKRAYNNYFANANVSNMFLRDIGASSISEYYTQLSLEDMPRVRYENLIGATFGANSITAWFSNFGYHDVAISLASVNNAVLRSLAPQASLTVNNYPLPFSIQDKAMVVTTGANIGFQLGFNVGLSMAFISAFFVLFPVMERTSGAQLLQKLSGVRPWVMWSVSLLFDWLSYVCLALIVVLTLSMFQEQTVSTATELGRILLVLMVFGFAMIPVHYLTIFTFSSPATGFAKMCFINTFTGVIPFMVTEILKLPILDTAVVANTLDWVFSLFPLYAMSRSIKELSMCEFALQACAEVCSMYGPACSRPALCRRANLTMCCIEDNPHLSLSEPGVGRYLLMMAMVGVAASALLMLAEYNLFNKISCSRKGKPLESNSDSVESEADVAAEERLVQSAADNEDLRGYHLLCRALTKRYPKLVAVDRISFAVRGEECFGLLGVNGAGKTSTFKMLTGSENISSGDAWVRGYSVKRQLGKVYQRIGYCPQFDALLDQLTGRETLHMFCTLRGIPRAAGSAGMQELALKLGLSAHLDKLVCNYSGGNKRKLSTAIALLGNAPLVYLDEPTTGMDPAAKRRVWRAVSEAAREGRSVVLTSHSMEECEALCSRLAIMVGGRFRCLGSPQHLKNKFSNGYTLIIKRTADVTTANGRKVSASTSGLEMTSTLVHDPVDEFVMNTFKDAKIVESYLGVSKYYLPDTELRWWQLFGSLESAKQQLDIADYAVMQTSLEEVFLRFTRQYSAEE